MVGGRERVAVVTDSTAYLPESAAAGGDADGSSERGGCMVKRWRKSDNPLLETVCAENNVDQFYQNLTPIPQATKSDF